MSERILLKKYRVCYEKKKKKTDDLPSTAGHYFH